MALQIIFLLFIFSASFSVPGFDGFIWLQAYIYFYNFVADHLGYVL